MADRIKGITVEIGGDVTGLNKALAGTNKEIKSTQDQLKDVERLLKLDPKNTVLLEQKQRLLGDSVKENVSKLDTLKKASEGVTANNEKYEEWSKSFSKIQEQTTKAQKELSKLQQEQKKFTEGSDDYNRLQSEIDATTEKITDLEKKAADTFDELGRPISTDQYDALQREIIATERKLNQLADESDATDRAIHGIDEKPIEEVERAADQAGDALNDAEKDASSFGDVLKAGVVIEGAKALIGVVSDLNEETKEYRKIMGTLDVSSEAAGYSAEQTAKTYKQLYGVLGDDQTAATTTANLQALHLSQGKLTELTNASIGAWARYGDSIPIDGLAESINETVKAGQVTGTFADVLNWGSKEGETFGVMLKENTKENEEWNKAVENATSAEDYFNLALQDAGSEAERANIVLQAMSDQGLTKSGEAWRENNKDIVAANESQAEFTDKAAEMAERVAPAMQAVKDGGNDLFQVFLDATEQIDFEELSETIGNIFEVVSAIITFLIDNNEPILAVLAGIAAGLVALQLVSLIGTLSAVASGATTVAAAFPLIGSAISMLTNPVFIVTAAIVALVVLIATKGDEIQAILQKLDTWLQSVFATDWTTIFGPVLGSVLNGFFANLKNICDSIYQIFNGVIDFIRGVFTGDWERAWNGIVQIFGGVFNGLVALAKMPINGIIGLLNGAIGAINYLIGGLNGIGFSLPSWLGGGSFQISIPSIPNIPYLAKGGILSQGSAVVGEAGPELLTVGNGKAVVQPLSGNNGHVDSQVGGNAAGSQGVIEIVVPVNLDGYRVGEATYRYIQQRERAYG